MYLYHYFIPLLFSFILFGLVVMEIQMIGKFKITEHGRALTLLSIAALIFVSFHFYRPLTYYEPITDEAFQKRVIFPLWEMKCANCDRESILVKPRKEDKEEKD